MKVLAVAQDAERLAIDLLEAALLTRGEDVSVGITVPAEWVKGTKAHIQVALDGSESHYPIYSEATIRITAWHESTTTAKRLAALCEGLLLSQDAFATHEGTGVLPAKDPDTGAQLASITVGMSLRFTAPA